jgi:EmrB/QacA subfamily drug resistance transporter
MSAPTDVTTPIETRSGPPPATRAAWLALAVVLAAEIMDLLDTTIVSVASPAIRDDLGGSYSSIQWIAAGYTLAFAVVLITGARLGDLFGRKRIFLIGLVGFTALSACCALAASPGMLIGFRLVQGVFAALLIPQGFGLVRAAFPPESLGKAFAWFGPVLGLSAVAGPVIGGALVDADLFGTGWRMIFLINVPVGIAALIGAVLVLTESTPAPGARLDPIGAVLATLGAFLVVYPLVQGRELGWPWWIFCSLACGVLIFVAFGAHLVRTARNGGSPLVLPSLFRKRSFTGSLFVGVIFFAAMSGLLLVFSLYLQIGLGFTPLHAALSMAPWSLGIAVGAGLGAGLLLPRLGRLVIVGGALVMGLGTAGTWLTVQLAGNDVNTWELIPSLLLSGVGMGCVVAPFFNIALGGVDDAEVGSASGLLNAVQQFGGSVGVAVLATLFISMVGDAGGPSVFTDATKNLLLIETGLMVVVAALGFLLPRMARPEDDIPA